jgi:hypothetical protein
VTLGSDGFGQRRQKIARHPRQIRRPAARRSHQGSAYQRKLSDAAGDATKLPDRDLHLESLAAVLRQEVPLDYYRGPPSRHRRRPAAAAEFSFRLILDSAAEAYLVLDALKAAKVPVIVHPTMARASGEQENLKFTQAAELHAAGIPFAFQSGYEQYVPKTRVRAFEAAMAAAHGLPPAQALAACTLRPAEILGLAGSHRFPRPGQRRRPRPLQRRSARNHHPLRRGPSSTARWSAQ